MDNSYIASIRFALTVFPGVSMLLTLPYMIYNYRKYGAVSPLRSFILFSFLFYLMCAYFLVILPLPDPAEVAQRQTPVADLTPFSFVRGFFEHSSFRLSDPSTYLPALKSAAFLEPAFNLLLTVPLGVYLSYYFREKLLKTTVVTFLLSLFFELTQLSALYGIYPRPYRLFSVDDLMLNTLGGLLGYSLGLAVRHILPSKKRIDENAYARSRKVGYLRRFTADFLDMSLLLVVTVLLTAWLPSNPFGFPVLFLLYFVGVQALTKGRTLGKLLVNVRVEALKRRPPLFFWLLLRYLLVLLPLWSVEWLWRPAVRTRWAWALYLWIAGVFLAYLISWIAGFFKKKRLWYEALSRTALTSTFRPKDRDAPKRAEESA